MARITFNDIQTNLGVTNTYDIVNAIRNSASDTFKNYVPLAHAENVAEVGAGIMMNQATQNEFITSLVDRIGLVVIRQVTLKNQLGIFKKGQMPLGSTIEEIFIDITKAKKYDAEDSETTVFKRQIPNVKTLFHERNRQDYYEQTIQDSSLKTAFVTWGNFEGFVAGIINAIYNSAEADEYEYMKLLVDNYYAKGLFKVVKVDQVAGTTTAQEFVKRIRATARKMSLPSGTRDFNSLAVRTRSDMDDLYLLIDADLEAELDVDVLAKAFNMDKTTFMGHVTVIDGFSSVGLEAVMVDREWFMVYDNLLKMETIRNPKGLYWNYFYHVWQTLSVSRFANAVAFVSEGAKDVTQVIVDPTIGSLKAGRSLQFNAYVRDTDGVKREVTWTVEGTQDTTLMPGTAVNEKGILTLAETQMGEVKVSASVTIGEGEEEELVTGEAIISVIPNLS